MKIIGQIFLPIALVFMACRKDPIIQLPPICGDTTLTLPQTCLGGNYYQYSTDNYTIINRSFQQSTIQGFTFVPFKQYQYGQPVFNPNNPYEFVYGRLDDSVLGFDVELWVFSFCTGQTRFLTNNASHNVDWSKKDWISFTGTDGLIYKIKSNGDSLISFPPLAGLNNAGRWNPSGTLIWSESNILDENGNIFFVKDPMDPSFEDWLDDSTLVGLGENFHIYSHNINSGEIIQLNNNWTCATCYFIYNPDENVCYVRNVNWLVKYSLDGSNLMDTVSTYAMSHGIGEGDYANGKRIHALFRQHWADSLNDYLFFQVDLAIMDADGSNERLIELPE